jgi:hypothetical protein
MIEEKACSRCKEALAKPGQRWCRACFAAYMRESRARHVAGGFAYVCAGCGGFAEAGDFMIDSGLTLTCPECGGQTIADLFTPDGRAQLYRDAEVGKTERLNLEAGTEHADAGGRLMIRVLIESPFAGDRRLNLAYLSAAILDSLMRGEAPFAGHLFYTRVLDDNVPTERALGINAGHSWGLAAELTAVYTDLGISGGMKLGVERAVEVGRPVEMRSLPPWADLGNAVATRVLLHGESLNIEVRCAGCQRPTWTTYVPGLPASAPPGELCGCVFTTSQGVGHAGRLVKDKCELPTGHDGPHRGGAWGGVMSLPQVFCALCTKQRGV